MQKKKRRTAALIPRTIRLEPEVIENVEKVAKKKRTNFSDEARKAITKIKP